jgi:hypothetical protein
VQAARVTALLGIALVVTAVAGCGGSAKQQSASPPPPATSAPPPPTTPSPPPPPPPPAGPGALQGEATSAATGDIPDNQVFLLFRNAAAGYSMKYPEGWAQSGAGGKVVFRDKNNIVRILVANGPVPSMAAVTRALRTLRGARVQKSPHATTIGGGAVVKVVYTTESAPNAVTGKRVTLTVDRYYLGQAGKEAIVDLGTPVGVDNVDAYRLMIESFRWR